jgi:hypothetical protein
MIIVDPLQLPVPFNIGSHHLTASNIAETEYTDFDITATIAVEDIRQVVDVTATITMTIANPIVVTWSGADPIAEDMGIRITTTGALPTGLVAGTIYYLRNVSDAFGTFNLSTTPGGTKLAASGTQSGTHTGVLQLHNVYEALAETAVFTAQYNVSAVPFITVSAITTGEITVGMWCDAAGINPRTVVTSFKSGTGGTGTYNVSVVDSGTGPIASTGNQPYYNSSYWLHVRYTNRWSMHDNSGSSQSSRVGDITNEYTVDGVVDSVVLLNINAATVQVIATDGVAGEVYNTTKTTESLSTITGLTEQHSSVTFLDLPTAYSDLVIDVILTATGETVLCGSCGIGKSLDYGDTQYGLKIGIQDFSVKTTDDFGVVTTTPRGYSREMVLTSVVNNDDLDLLFKKLVAFRAKAVFYIGDDTQRTAVVYGFFTDFNIEIAYPTASLISIEIEGLV